MIVQIFGFVVGSRVVTHTHAETHMHIHTTHTPHDGIYLSEHSSSLTITGPAQGKVRQNMKHNMNINECLKLSDGPAESTELFLVLMLATCQCLTHDNI